MDQRLFARHLLDEPASFYDGVMWNKLYRRNLILEHDIRGNEALQWSEDFQFNLEYIRYAQTFCAGNAHLLLSQARRQFDRRPHNRTHLDHQTQIFLSIIAHFTPDLVCMTNSNRRSIATSLLRQKTTEFRFFCEFSPEPLVSWKFLL